MGQLTQTGIFKFSYDETSLFSNCLLYAHGNYLMLFLFCSVSMRRNDVAGNHQRSKFTTTTGKSVELRKPEVCNVYDQLLIT